MKNLAGFITMCHISLGKCMELMKQKNDDYAKEDDVFRNLTVHAKIIKLLELDYGNRLHQPLGHMIEKIHRIANLLNKKQKPKNETIDDSLRDIIIFDLLFKGMWEEDREKYEIEGLTVKIGEDK